MASSYQAFPVGINGFSTPMVEKAIAYAKEHCDDMTIGHVMRSAHWATIIAKKIPAFADGSVDMEVVIVGGILHDMGWSKNKDLISAHKRFEVDGADIARSFIQKCKSEGGGEFAGWDTTRIQRLWDAIVLHTTPSISMYAAPEVALMGMGVSADFAGPNFPHGPGHDNLISLEEYRAGMTAYPRVGFTSAGFTKLMCGMCQTKPHTTFDNFVGYFGCKFGFDGEGDGRDKYTAEWEQNQFPDKALAGLGFLEQLDAENSVNI